MANFVTTLPKLTSPANYSFYEICVKSTLALIIYFGAIFTTNDILNALALPQIIDIDEITRKNFLDSQALAVLNSILPDNLLIHGQPNAKIFWAYLQTLIEMSGPASIFTDYQRTIIFQISSDQDPALQIAELDFLYIRLHKNDYNILSALRVMTLLSTISHSQNSISASILFSHTSISNLT